MSIHEIPGHRYEIPSAQPLYEYPPVDAASAELSSNDTYDVFKRTVADTLEQQAQEYGEIGPKDFSDLIAIVQQLVGRDGRVPENLSELATWIPRGPTDALPSRQYLETLVTALPAVSSTIRSNSPYWNWEEQRWVVEGTNGERAVRLLGVIGQALASVGIEPVPSSITTSGIPPTARPDTATLAPSPNQTVPARPERHKRRLFPRIRSGVHVARVGRDEVGYHNRDTTTIVCSANNRKGSFILATSDNKQGGGAAIAGFEQALAECRPYLEEWVNGETPYGETVDTKFVDSTVFQFIGGRARAEIDYDAGRGRNASDEGKPYNRNNNTVGMAVQIFVLNGGTYAGFATAGGQRDGHRGGGVYLHRIAADNSVQRLSGDANRSLHKSHEEMNIDEILNSRKIELVYPESGIVELHKGDRLVLTRGSVSTTSPERSAERWMKAIRRRQVRQRRRPGAIAHDLAILSRLSDQSAGAIVIDVDQLPGQANNVAASPVLRETAHKSPLGRSSRLAGYVGKLASLSSGTTPGSLASRQNSNRNSNHQRPRGRHRADRRPPR